MRLKQFKESTEIDGIGMELILVLRFSRLEFNVQHRLSGMSHVKC
jgi:hypothetical protein